MADDNALIREALGEWLTHESGVEVAALSSSGSEAVTMAEAAGPDVAIVDWTMPDMDGLEVARHIAARQPELPVILYTTRRPPLSWTLRASQRSEGSYARRTISTSCLRRFTKFVAGNVAFPPPT